YGDIAMPADAPLRLRLTAAAPGAGGGLRIRIDAFKLLTPLQAWREQHFGSAAPDGDAADDADPDRDGLPNLAEFATGHSPLTPHPPGLIAAATDTLPRRLTLAFTPLVPPPLAYPLAAADHPADWSPLAPLPPGAAAGTGPATVIETPLDETRRSVVVVDTADLAASPRRFLRLRVGQP